MTQRDIERIHERLDAIQKTTTQIAATCSICRPIVLGNGGNSLDKRVGNLETMGRASGKGFWIVVVAIASTISGLITAVSAAAVHYLVM